MKINGNGSFSAAALLATGLLAGRGASAQLLPPLSGEPTPPASGRTYGTTAQTAYTVGAFDLESLQSGTTYSFVNMKAHRYMTNSGILAATLHLPAGALVEKMEVEACDTSTAGEVAVGLGFVTAPDGDAGTFGLVETGTLFAGGCALFPVTLASPVTIDNRNKTYFVSAQNTTFDAATSIGAVRLFYRLQVSPAPMEPTFGDVPTDYLYYRAIEAMAAAGITSGCGGGNFCPNQTVTRGELAKFFANALGLHWGN
jgi:hypothetical protein